MPERLLKMPLSGDGPSFRIIAKWGGFFEERSGFGIGEEFFLMFNLERLLLNDPMAHGGMGGTMVMGPMIMVGKIDPSTNFSYPANRQYILNVPGRIEAGGIRRFTLAPYAFASKFFGMETGEGEPVEVTKEVLYNTTGDFGLISIKNSAVSSVTGRTAEGQKYRCTMNGGFRSSRSTRPGRRPLGMGPPTRISTGRS